MPLFQFSPKFERDLFGQRLALFATGSLAREACSTYNILCRLANISEIYSIRLSYSRYGNMP